MVAWFFKPRNSSIAGHVDGVFLLDGLKYPGAVDQDEYAGQIPDALEFVYERTGYKCIAVHTCGGYRQLLNAARIMSEHLDDLQIGVVSFCVVVSMGDDVWNHPYYESRGPATYPNEMIRKDIADGMLMVKEICNRLLSSNTLLVYGSNLLGTKDEGYIEAIVQEIRSCSFRAAVLGDECMGRGPGKFHKYHYWARLARTGGWDLPSSKL
jgi:hypothetical protein